MVENQTHLYAGEPIITFQINTPLFISTGTVWLRWRNSAKISSVSVSIVIPMYRRVDSGLWFFLSISLRPEMKRNQMKIDKQDYRKVQCFQCVYISRHNWNWIGASIRRMNWIGILDTHTFYKEILYIINGYGKADTGSDFHWIYAYNFAIQIDKWSTRIAKCNSSIRLNVVDVFSWRQKKPIKFSYRSKTVTLMLYIPCSPSSFDARCGELTTPAVTVLFNVNGLPNATTHSPARKSADFPSFNIGKFLHSIRTWNFVH